MSKNNTPPDLTKTEYDILRILWKFGELSIREIHEKIVKIYNWAFSTTKTMTDRMLKKGFLKKESRHGILLYTPELSRPMGLARLIDFFSDRVLELDHTAVVSLFTQNKTLSDEEIEELSGLLDKVKEEK